MDSSAKWTQLYGTDPTMEWSKYAVVDPQKFDAAFAGKPSAPANAK
jgi:hypothetical protein